MDAKTGGRRQKTLGESTYLSSSKFKNPDQPQKAPTFNERVEVQDYRASAKSLPKTISLSVDGAPIMSKDDLNKLNSQVIKAKLMKLPSHAELDGKYKRELARFEASQVDVVIVKDKVPKKTNEEKGKSKYTIVLLP